MTIRKDMYWEVNPAQMYDIPSNEPPELFIGQLYEDWEFLQTVLKSGDVYDGVPPLFMHVAPLLMYMAYRGEFFSGSND